jgi:hypothetical protein
MIQELHFYIYPKELEADTPTFIVILFTIAKGWNIPGAYQWMNEEPNVTHAYSGIFFSFKDIGNFDIQLMNFEDITLSNISQTQKDKYCMIPLT